MLELKDGFVLYHGSYCEVKEPDLAKCAKRKDFGQGFYLTTSKEQAESFLRTSIAKAIATGTIEEGQKFGYISTFEFNLSGNLEMHIFENADVDWLHCIAAHRKKKMFIEVEREMARYDIIAGKIADDATNAKYSAYPKIYSDVQSTQSHSRSFQQSFPVFEIPDGLHLPGSYPRRHR